MRSDLCRMIDGKDNYVKAVHEDPVKSLGAR